MAHSTRGFFRTLVAMVGRVVAWSPCNPRASARHVQGRTDDARYHYGNALHIYQKL